MSKQVAWTDRLTEDFIKFGALSEEEAYIMRSRVRGATVVQQSIYLNCSESKVHRTIALLKRKYDCVQAENPDKFPKRKKSAKETWMDEN